MKRRMKHRSYTNKSFLSRRAERKSKKNFFLTLIICAFLIFILFAWFIPTFISSLSLLNRFKEPTKISKSISDNAFLAPPVLNIPYEATNTATILVRGYTTPDTTVEIYLDNQLESTTKSVFDGSFISDQVNLNLGSNSISGKTVDASGNKSYGSKPIVITYSNEKPILDVTEPQDNLVITGGDKKVTVSGKTNSDKEIAITINGNRAIVNSDGNFSQTVQINEGDNDIVIQATDKAGNVTEVTKKVKYQN
jgi:hypothetical protein